MIKNSKEQLLYQLSLWVIGGKIVFLASAWLLPSVSRFSLFGDNISELTLGHYGFIQTSAFIISGIATLALVYTIHRQTVSSKKLLAGLILIAIYGAGAVLSAFFPTDQIDSQADLKMLSSTGIIHLVIALISFFCVICGMVILTWTFRKRKEWKTLARPGYCHALRSL